MRLICTFRQRDVTAAVKAVAAAGREAQRVKIDADGCIIIDLVIVKTEPVDELDAELKQFEAVRGEG